MGAIDYRKSAQTVRDDMRGHERTLLHRGSCACCGMRVFGFTDGEDDPRGMLDERRCYVPFEGHEYPDMHPSANVMGCFLCANEQHSYDVLMRALARESKRLYRREQATCEGLG